MTESTSLNRAQQAAKASWIAPFIAFGANSFGRSLEPSQRLLLAVVGWLVFALGLALAVYALAAVPRHGAKGVLAPGLIGLAFNLAAVALIGSTMYYSLKTTREEPLAGLQWTRQQGRSGFSILLPDKPKVTTQKGEIEEGTIEATSYLVEAARGTVVFQVIDTRYPDGWEFDREASMEGVVEEYQTSLATTLRSEKAVSGGREYLMDSEKVNLRVRVVFEDPHMVQVKAMWDPSVQAPEEEISRFLDSIDLSGIGSS